MTRGDNFSVFLNQLDQLSVGFGPFIKEWQSLQNQTTYPPHNLIRIAEDQVRLELAVAGFKKDEVTMQEHQGLVTIKGEKKTPTDAAYQYRGIAGRSFEKSFRLVDYYEVADATLEDGILTVNFIRNVPEAAKPKVIAIK